jgi:hypothetical protein
MSIFYIAIPKIFNTLVSIVEITIAMIIFNLIIIIAAIRYGIQKKEKENVNCVKLNG